MELICKESADALPDTEGKTGESQAPVITCRACNSFVAEPSDQVTINGLSCHTFANPHGIVYEIVCFSKADGCSPGSPPSAEFSWFKGFVWEVGICRACQDHLGWIFSKDQERFWGLIPDKLIFP